MSWKKFTYRTLLFLIPVCVAVLSIEYLVRNIPNSINTSSSYFKQEKNNIKSLVLSASQNKRAINPEYLSTNTLTVAGSRQGHKTDYYLLKDLHKQLPNLERVFIGVTVRHFESRPNPKDFWKYRSFLVYYNVNAFEKPTYFKERFIYLGNPNFYTDKLEAFYLNKERDVYNKFGFHLEGIKDRFSKLHYDEETIINTFKFGKDRALNKKYLDLSTSWFHKTLAYCQDNNIKVILTKTPTYKNYKLALNQDVIKRRDSIVEQILKMYLNTRLFDEESSPSYTIKHFINESHLNPEGAKLFTKKLDTFIQENE